MIGLECCCAIKLMLGRLFSKVLDDSLGHDQKAEGKLPSQLSGQLHLLYPSIKVLTATASALTPLSISSTHARSCSRERPVLSSFDISCRTEAKGTLKVLV